MIYDNPYCMRQAEWLVKSYLHDPEKLTKEISGELCRLHGLGQESVLSIIRKAITIAEKTNP